MLSVGLVLAKNLQKTSCASYPGVVVLVQLIVVWRLTILHFVEAPETEVRAGDIGPVLGLQNIK